MLRNIYCLLVTACVLSSCEKKSRVFSTPSLDQSRELVANGIWDREVDIVKDGTSRIRVNGIPPYRVFVTADSVYRDHMKENKAMDELTEGVFVRSVSTAPDFTTAVRLPLGKYWISIENQGDAPAQYRLILDGWYQ